MLVIAGQFRDVDRARAGSLGAWHMLGFPVIPVHGWLANSQISFWMNGLQKSGVNSLQRIAKQHCT